MRITCEQCGQSITSPTCRKFCDEKKKEQQLDRIAKEVEKVKSFIETSGR
jgi:hypothetical protein